MTFRDREKRRLRPLKHKLFSEAARRNGMYRGARREFCLHEDFRSDNLEPGIRDAALAYFEDRGIGWHDGKGNEPSNHLCCSQSSCVMRQQLLCTAMERDREMNADVVSLLHVAPRANGDLMKRVTSKGLEGVGLDIHSIWDALTLPGRFKGTTTEDLLALVCANAPKTQTREYLKLRYGAMA